MDRGDSCEIKMNYYASKIILKQMAFLRVFTQKQPMVDFLLNTRIGRFKVAKVRSCITFPTLVVFKQSALGLCNYLRNDQSLELCDYYFPLLHFFYGFFYQKDQLSSTNTCC